MSYALNPQVIRAAAPGASNDNTQGFVVGSIWVDSTPAIDQAYICTSAATGAATWVSAGGVSSHPSLTTLGWSASGHTGTQTSVACFDAVGAAQTVQATADGQVLQRIGGVLVFAAVAATVGIGAAEDRTRDVWYFAQNADLIPTPDSAATGPGSIV